MTTFNFMFRDPNDNWQSRVLYAMSALGLAVYGRFCEYIGE